MRGAPFASLDNVFDLGIIPAFAESTTARQREAPSARDHPRVCGEHTLQDSGTSSARGSSPRMRGAQREPVHGAGDVGIIPAYAGSTAWRTRRLRWPWDHPRVCGEHLLILLHWRSLWGSSPRMRGAPRR